VVIQSYLYRSEKDIRALGELATRVRLCKGAYKEPQEVAFPRKIEVDENFDRLVDLLIAQEVAAGSHEISDNGRFPAIPGIATHDNKRIEYAKRAIRKAGLSQKAVEFQMLYGIRRDLQQQLVNEGYPVRVYVPYGTRWYPYFMRRLAERPANIWFFISNFFRR
jgi:proline dehydrogenase